MRRAALVLSAICLAASFDATPSAAQGDAADSAYVESVDGRVVALVQGKPVLLDVLDTIADRTRIDLLGNSGLRVCHYQKQRIVTVTGPMRVSVTSAGVIAEGGKEIVATTETCVKPVVSNFQGGFVARTTGAPPPSGSTNVGLKPNIKLVNRGTNTITGATLWDSTQQRVIATFIQNKARADLDEGQVYHLVVSRSDGSESRMTLRASGAVSRGPLILMVP